MNDLISRRAAIKAIEDFHDCYNGFSDTYDKACIIGAIEEVPSIEPVKHGKWILQDHYPVCNKCKGRALRDDIGMAILSEYCPACGAKMDEKEQNR